MDFVTALVITKVFHHSQANQTDTCTDFAVCLNEIIIDLRTFEYGTTGAFHLDNIVYFFEAREF